MEPNIDEIERQILEGNSPPSPWDEIILSLIQQLRELKKGKTVIGSKIPTSLGVYEFEGSTPRFHKYSRKNEKDIKETLYVNKDHFESGEKPSRIEFYIRKVS